ncbi:immunity 49 family protein [Streptomyces scabiei]|uniref:immunity 49 family protein n=1 Tax=Streptomyces scabiei TaxID=1930 RepID=UPI0029903668|nr:immunity 49 family protein [Streptomyces scabiei]MDW8803683.1 immunity 49 family protein [Streptomyces scabiei]
MQHHAFDADLPMLTVPQADLLRDTTSSYFLSRYGVRPTIEAGVVEHDGHRNPLTTLAQKLRPVPEEQWPQLIGEHFARLEVTSQGGHETAQEMLAQTYLRLLPADALPPEGQWRYVRPVAGELVEALSLDAPTWVRLLDDTDVARAGLEELRAAGRANLLSVPVEHEEVRGPRSALLHSVFGASHFVSSKALVLPDLVRALTGLELPEAGALVAVPTRHLLAFHLVVDHTVVEAVNDLAAYSLGAYEDGPGSLTPRLFWWHQGRLVEITEFDHDSRSLTIVPPPELLEVMQNLVAQDGAVGTAPAAVQPARTVVELTGMLETDPSVLGEALVAAVADAHARCADDPDAAELETWEAWVTAMQLGSALFATASAREGTVECRIGHRVLSLPAGPNPYAEARAWIDAFWLALICREGDRLTMLSRYPLEELRRSSPDDEYLFSWIDTLQSLWLRQPMEKVADTLLLAMRTSHPEVATRTPRHFLELIDYAPIGMFHRLITNDNLAFTSELNDALDCHDTYWKGADDPRARVALGPLAIACLALDWGMTVDASSPYLPKHLLQRSWHGEFDT